MFTRKGFERRRGGGRKFYLLPAVGLFLAVEIPDALFNLNDGGRCKIFEGLSPKSLGLLYVLLFEPGDVVAVRARLVQTQGFAQTECVIKRENLFQQDWKRPDVEQQMMISPDELVNIILKLYERQTHQGRFGELEPTTTVSLNEVL